ncbi:MAG TPA: SpoIVB peptidase S55 domain-containing protein [Terriglobales bacterium]|nr:SpoIVB peptidase S55 domain-containing protein [Terriglobales bacterium]
MRTLILALSLLAVGAAQTAIMPLSQIHAGMHGVGRTIFQGDTVSDFQVDILGVVSNLGPRQAVIFAKLSGGPLADTGVIEGMSGSPVYIDGKLIGAVALGYPFSKSAIAGITPIEQMMAQQKRATLDAKAESALPRTLAWDAKPGASQWESISLPELKTPLVLSGFSQRALTQFLPQWENFGLRPQLGPGAGAAALDQPMGDPKDLKPGDMISVQLLRGDLGISADGTVTYIDGNQIYAFGHRFLAAGTTAMPFNKASVLTLIPGLMTSTKMDTPGEPMGVIHQDLSQGVYGSFGGHASMIPIHVHIHRPGQPVDAYSFEMVDSRVLSPVLLNMALYSTLDANERGIGTTTFQISEAIQVGSGEPLKFSDLYTSDQGGPLAAAAGAARPLTMLYGSRLDPDVKGLDIDVNASDQKRVLTLEQVWTNTTTVAPGAKFEVTALFASSDGGEITRAIPLEIPESQPAGDLTVWVGDGAALQRMQPPSADPVAAARDLPRLLAALGQLPVSNRIYARITAPQTAYEVAGRQFPAPPPSLARALASDGSSDRAVISEATSTVADYRGAPLTFVVSGLKSIRIRVEPN